VSAEPTLAATLSATDARGRGVRVRFFLQANRVTHRIDTVDGLLSNTLLESIDGELIADWPSSPPLQHVSVSSIVSDTQQGNVAMLTGATSHGHWSMCVAARDGRTVPQYESTESELLFDVACRIDGTPMFLGSSYRSMVRGIAISDRLNFAFVPGDEPGCVLITKDAQLEIEGNRSRSPVLRCKATELRSADSPATLRWQYAIRRSSGGPFSIAAKAERR
jgi:hypothetical protein